MINLKEIKAKLAQITECSGFGINSYKIINTGSESLVIEVNKEWMFRFSRRDTKVDRTAKIFAFLKSFSEVSNLQVPVPEFIEQGFVGYKKILGKPFHKSNIQKLSSKERLDIAKQLAEFLSALHNFDVQGIDFDTGYLVMRKGDYASCPEEIMRHLNAPERKALEAKFRQIETNHLNFENPKSVIHGDLYFNNLLWDKETRKLTGVIDWAEAGLGVPAMDFIMLADFNGKSNDKFLKDILNFYGAESDEMFFQIKQNAIIDTMNWYWSYFKQGDTKKMMRMIGRLKKVL